MTFCWISRIALILAILPAVEAARDERRQFTGKNSRPERILLVNQPISPSHVRLMHRIGRELQARGHHITELRYPLTETVGLMGEYGWAYDSVVSMRSPAGFDSVEFTWGREPERVRALSDYIDSWAWTKQDTMVDVADLILRNTVLNADFPNLVARWVDTAKLLIEPCLELHWTRHVIDQLSDANITLALMDPVAFPCARVLLNHLNVPYMFISNFVEYYELDHCSGTPVAMSYVTAAFGTSTDHMSLPQRALNVPMHYMLDIVHSGILLPLANIIAGQYQSPILTKTSCEPVGTLVNGQRYFDDYAKPLTQTMITFNLQGNGITQPISEDLLAFIESPDSKGTIVLSMSTTTTSSTMNPHLQQQFIQSFEHFKDYRIIWRMDGVSLCNTSSACAHIRTFTWIPQHALLTHPTTRVLITHGGINSIVEALSHSIPMIAIPMFGDQFPNAARVEARGVGKMLQKNELHLLPSTLTEVMLNDRYRRRAGKVSAMIGDQERLRPMRDSSVFWIEWAGRHRRSARWLKPRGSQLSHISYFMLDIFAFYTLVVVVCITLLTKFLPLAQLFVVNVYSVVWAKAVRICSAWEYIRQCISD